MKYRIAPLLASDGSGVRKDGKNTLKQAPTLVNQNGKLGI